jgi:hypothetical protein
MTGRRTLLLSLCAGALAAAPAHAEDVPIEISWQGDPPTSISRSGDDGQPNLTCDQATRTCRGHFSVRGNGLERRTLIVTYGLFNHPIDVRIYRLSPGVIFTVTYQGQRSCTEARVNLLSVQANNLADAINRSLAAGQLLSIASPNDCDANLQWRAAQARYNQSVRMAHLSRGLFLVNDQIARDYRGQAERHGVSVAVELAAYADTELQLEAVQLVAARTEAQAQHAYMLAGEINDLLTERLRSDQAIRQAFRVQGVVERQLALDGAYLRTMSVRYGYGGPED